MARQVDRKKMFPLRGSDQVCQKFSAFLQNYRVTAALRFALITCGLLIATTDIANAYIDPNTGGLLFQILAPVFAVVASIWVIAKEKVSKLFKRCIDFFVPNRKNTDE